uniref:[Histone H3]-trimethyl-L-lysine(9) demethylase n=1 Tax=Panagrellus redivivus TaxID=6233 RepID=A0A7E4V8C6_PANRE
MISVPPDPASAPLALRVLVAIRLRPAMSNPPQIPGPGLEDAEISDSDTVSPEPPVLSRQDTLQSQSSATSSTPSTSEVAAAMPANFSACALLKQTAAAARANAQPGRLPSAASNDRVPPKFPTPRFNKQREWTSNGTTDVQIFHPSLEEMQDFSGYMEKIEREHGPHLSCGICKIIPPKAWSPTLSRSYDHAAIDELTIYDAVKETSERDPALPHGVFKKENEMIPNKQLSALDFRQMAVHPQYDAPKVITTLEELEKYYWNNTFKTEPIYGADTPGTLFDEEVNVFNITKLGTILDLLDEDKVQIKGVNTPYLYFGMYKTTFPWHSEDMDLYSINYVHLGEPKFWYAIPPEAADRFERLAAQFFPGYAKACKGFLRHKVFQVSPAVLRHHGIPYGTMVQYPGEFIITFPRGYHMGFNTGFNIAEATNFAIDRWIDYGKNVVMCNCKKKDRVEIAMQPYMERYRIPEMEEWHRYWYEKRAKCPKEVLKNNVKQSQLDRLYVNLPREQQYAAVIAGRQAENGQRKKALLKNVFSLEGTFDDEKKYNKAQGKIFPNCAVCQYFVPDLNLYTEFPSDFQMPTHSRRYVNNQMFTKGSGCMTDDPTDDDLLICDKCCVVVHRHCYAVIPQENGLTAGKFAELSPKGKFLCYRCRGRAVDQIKRTVCHFCPMRGGALIPAVQGAHHNQLFAHVICSMASRRTKVVAISGERTPLSLTLPSRKLLGKDPDLKLLAKLNPFKLTFTDAYVKGEIEKNKEKEKQKQKEKETEKPPLTPHSVQCDLCSIIGEDMVLCGLCPENNPRHMHATCARLLEVIFEARIYPKVIVPICSIHTCEVPSNIVNDLEYEIGDRVRLFDIEKNVREGEIVDLTMSEYRHSVNFLDDSTSSEVAYEEIVRCECNERLCDRINHIYGSVVYVTWDDNAIYEGYYRGKQREAVAKVAMDGPLHSPTKVTRRSINQEQVIPYDITKYNDIGIRTKHLTKIESASRKGATSGRGRGRGRGRKRLAGN